ncbi:MAG TPA: hypothetical protein ENN13_04400 [Candidatus Altiarchaeales archaeon]|nr:hypothetical protein [Candidatus Altiarchaeales archaeon]
METTIPEGLTASLEAAALILELIIFIFILVHMRAMRAENKLLKQNINGLHTLHMELHESISLLKEDIKDLKETDEELQEFMELFKNQARKQA